MSEWMFQQTYMSQDGQDNLIQSPHQLRLQKEYEELHEKNIQLKDQYTRLEQEIIQQERINQGNVEKEETLKKQYQEMLDERREQNDRIRSLQSTVKERYAAVEERYKTLSDLQAQRRELLSELTELQALQSRASQLYSEYAVCDAPEYLEQALNAVRERFSTLYREVQNQAAINRIAKGETQ